PAEILAQCGAESKLLFLCSPNNPTGNLFERRRVEALLDRFPGMVVLDEAYIDYADEAGFLALLDQFPKLIVLQTFSKARGLAGLRLGMAFAAPEIIQWLNRIKPPYNVNTQSQQIALDALQNQDRLPPIAYWQNEQKRLAKGLAKLDLVQAIYPSDANFLLVRFEDPDSIYKELVQQSIIVRNRSRLPRCEGCLRITVGTATENDQLLQMLQKLDKA
ncbi:MAG: aminotransferase class I/II-fold pyridoxal phosphate-dependent enzyme, partial [Phaeodactylibacter sp.]|nr:aminotransferase class I/II-fold pyridoxal phosphate-dependent enzyme [Phaeodactylibacter sp.]